MIPRKGFLTTKALADMCAHAVRAYPEEACGVVLTDDVYVPMENTAKDPTKSASMDRDYLNARLNDGTLKCLFHSHPDGPHCPSHYDMAFQEQVQVPFALVSTNGTACTPVSLWGDTLEPLPLIGRPFQHGITDCYAAIRDWWRLEKGVLLPEFPRSWAWWEHGQELYVKGFPAAGFRPMTVQETRQPRPGDVILFTIRSSTPNHGGVYVGDGLMYHHATQRQPYDPTKLSTRTPVARWGAHQPYWLRRDEDHSTIRGASPEVRPAA